MDRDAPMDSRLHQGMCNLSAKQDPYSSHKNTPLSDHDEGRNTPLSANHNGPYHRASTASWIQCHPDHSRPQMLTCSHLPTMFRHYDRSWNCPTISRLYLLMVWPTYKNDKWLRPQIYLSIWQSPYQETWHPTKPIHSLPPSNGWALQMKELMGGTILMTGDLKWSQGMDALACTSHGGTQQLDQHHHQSITQPDPFQIQPHA